MTNTQIIFNESVKLMNEGILKGTGEFIKTIVTDEEGNEIEKTLEIPETIHTFSTWKKLGRTVKKGEKAKAKFTIWKAKPQHVEMTDANGTTIEEDTVKMFMKLSFFFTEDQTEILA